MQKMHLESVITTLVFAYCFLTLGSAIAIPKDVPNPDLSTLNQTLANLTNPSDPLTRRFEILHGYLQLHNKPVESIITMDTSKILPLDPLRLLPSGVETEVLRLHGDSLDQDLGRGQDFVYSDNAGLTFAAVGSRYHFTWQDLIDLSNQVFRPFFQRRWETRKPIGSLHWILKPVPHSQSGRLLSTGEIFFNPPPPSSSATVQTA